MLWRSVRGEKWAGKIRGEEVGWENGCRWGRVKRELQRGRSGRELQRGRSGGVQRVRNGRE